jgi:hypothetical protein
LIVNSRFRQVLGFTLVILVAIGNTGIKIVKNKFEESKGTLPELACWQCLDFFWKGNHTVVELLWGDHNFLETCSTPVVTFHCWYTLSVHDFVDII